MTKRREKAMRMMIEIERRVYLSKHGSLKGSGKTEKYYRNEWRPRLEKFHGGYKEMMSNDILQDLMRYLGL